MLLPGCGCCQACNCAAGSRLPYSLTATFTDLTTRTHSNHALLTFSSDFGSGATGVLLSPGGCDDFEEDSCGPSDRGPLTGVLLTSGGTGYAALGRGQPTLTISASPGTGCTFTPTLSKNSSSGAPVWSLASVSVSEGTGYVDGTPLTITFDGACCQTVQTPPAAVLHTGVSRVQPTVTATANGVSGAVLAVTLASSGSPQTWHVASVNVTSPGSGFLTDGTVTFATSDVQEVAATATATPQYTNPGASYFGTGGAGVGFSATLTLSETTGGDGFPAWTPSAISITSNGSGYVVGDFLEFRAVGYDPGNGVTGIATYYVATIDGNGAVLTVSGPDGDFAELFRKSDGVASVTVTGGGSYYKETDDGIPASVTVTEPGAFWCLDPNAEPVVANVTVTAGGGGAGAVITPTIDVEPTSDSFGSILSLSISNAGKNYLAWHWECGNDATLNGLPFVLRAATPTPLVTLSIDSSFGCGAAGVVLNKGPRVAPVITLEPVCSSDAQTTCTGATLTPTITSAFNKQDGQYWTISSVAASGGTNCVDCTSAQPEGCFIQIAPANITLSSSGGQVTGATVVNGGKFYSQFEWDGSPSPIYAVALTNQGSGYAKIAREIPSGMTVVPADSSTGSGAKFSPAWMQTTDSLGLPTWTISSISVSGGIGYTDGEPLSFPVALDPPFYCLQPAAAIIKTGANSTVPSSVTVTRGGKYYKENPTLPGLAAKITVNVIQAAGSSGDGATITATVNNTVGHADFGKVTALNLVSGGSNYTLFGGPQDCRYIGGCRTGCTPPDNVSVIAQGGDTLYATVNKTHFRSSSSISDCSALPASPALWYGAESGSALITPGGTWDSRGTEGCGSIECLCPVDYIKPTTHVEVTSDVPCAEGGTAAYEGEWQDLNLSCGWKPEPNGPIVYTNDIGFGLTCCEYQCTNDDPCILKVRVGVFGYCYDPVTDTFCAVGAGEHSCQTINITNGEPSGTLTVPVIACAPPNEVEYSMTIVLGGA